MKKATITQAAELRREFWALPPEAQTSREMVAAAYLLSPASLEAYAIRGGGPPYMRIGRRALYRKADCLKWAAESGRVVENTAQLRDDAAPAEADNRVDGLVKASAREASVKAREPAAVAKAQATRKARNAAREGVAS